MTPRYALTGFLKFFRLCVGGDAHIAPLGSCEFAGDFRKNGAFRRVDVGIGPYMVRRKIVKRAGNARPYSVY